MKQLDKTITVGFAGGHGMIHEACQNPPEGIEYRVLNAITSGSRLIRSPIKGFMRQYDDSDVDILEGVISPPVTKKPWVYSIACFQEPMAFSFSGVPIPKRVRRYILEKYFLNSNCKQLVFWSQAGFETLKSYGGYRVFDEIVEKSVVVYPAIRHVDTPPERGESESLQIMFSGDFFLKGGAHVVDAFETLQNEFPNAYLRLCCNAKTDFRTSDTQLREEYLAKVTSHPRIILGRVPREEMLNEILPKTDVYMLPTYSEAFGFAIPEAMAYGIPVIATELFAIPEIIDHDQSGLLIPTGEYNMTKMFKGCAVQSIPPKFKQEMSVKVTHALRRLLESKELRRKIGVNARETVRDRFSFDKRRTEMSSIYRNALL